MKKILVGAILLLISFSSLTVKASTSGKLNETEVVQIFSVSSQSITLDQYDTSYFEVSITDGISSLDNIKVEIANPNIVSINLHDKSISGLAVGNTTITLTLLTQVSVIQVSVGEKTVIQLEDSEFYLIRGLSYNIPYTLTPSDQSSVSITWTSSNPSIAQVENGRVKGLAIGQTTITATVDGSTSSMKLYVTAPLQAIEFSPSELSISIGETSYPIQVNLKPKDTTDSTKIVYKVADSLIVRLNEDNTLTGLKQGTTEVIATNGQFEARLKVVVNSNLNDNGNTLLSLDTKLISAAQIEVRVGETINESLKKNYAIILPEEIINNLLSENDLVFVNLFLNPFLVNQDFKYLKELLLPESITQNLAGKTLIINIQTSYGTPLIKYQFKNAFSKPINLIYSLYSFKEETKLGNQIGTSGYRIDFKQTNGFPLGTSVFFAGSQLEANVLDKRYIYTYNLSDNSIVFANQISEVDESNNLEIVVESPNLIITNFKLKNSNSTVLYGVLTGLVIIGISAVVYITMIDKRNKANK